MALFRKMEVASGTLLEFPMLMLRRLAPARRSALNKRHRRPARPKKRLGWKWRLGGSS